MCIGSEPWDTQGLETHTGRVCAAGGGRGFHTVVSAAGLVPGAFYSLLGFPYSTPVCVHTRMRVCVHTATQSGYLTVSPGYLGDPC